jgi:hypothetical protein
MIWTLILGVVILITAYYVFALLFHWVKYGATLPLVWLAMPIYLVGVGFLLLIALAAYSSLV